MTLDTTRPKQQQAKDKIEKAAQKRIPAPIKRDGKEQKGIIFHG